MSWEVQLSARARKQLLKLDKPVASRVIAGLRKLEKLDSPQAHCKALTGGYAGLWRYREGNYRVIIDFQQEEMVILALEIGHRSKIYE